MNSKPLIFVSTSNVPAVEILAGMFIGKIVFFRDHRAAKTALPIAGTTLLNPLSVEYVCEIGDTVPTSEKTAPFLDATRLTVEEIAEQISAITTIPSVIRKELDGQMVSFGDSGTDNHLRTVQGETAVKLPTLGVMVASATKSMAAWAKSGFKTVTEDQFNIRLSACKSCEFWDSEALKGTGRCRKCGCSTWAKLRLSHEKCPVDKWGSLT